MAALQGRVASVVEILTVTAGVVDLDGEITNICRSAKTYDALKAYVLAKDPELRKHKGPDASKMFLFE